MSKSPLFEFINSKMQMAQVYQPAMLISLLTNGGECSERDIAKRLLGHDESQTEYYQKITRDMVGQVLQRHKWVERERERPEPIG